ncbi:MAG: hypothetical protein ACKO45_12140 [Cyanobium sp.]
MAIQQHHQMAQVLIEQRQHERAGALQVGGVLHAQGLAGMG